MYTMNPYSTILFFHSNLVLHNYTKTHTFNILVNFSIENAK